MVRDEASGKHQADRMTAMAKAAVTHLAAEIVVPLDANEFMSSGNPQARGACLRSHRDRLSPACRNSGQRSKGQ